MTVGALVAVNAVGSVIQQEQKHFWAAPFEVGSEFGGHGSASAMNPLAEQNPFAPLTSGTNTTIAIVATDAALTQAQATRMAVAAHDGMARAIVPSHTPFDGDLVFAAATGKKPLSDPPMDQLALGQAAALCLSRAIARGVYEAQAAARDTLPTWQDKWG